MSARFRAALLASTVLAAPAFAQQIGAPISQLPSAALPLSGTEPVPLVQGGVTVKAPASALGGFAPFVATGGTTPQSPAARSGWQLTPQDFGAPADTKRVQVFGVTATATSPNITMATAPGSSYVGANIVVAGLGNGVAKTVASIISGGAGTNKLGDLLTLNVSQCATPPVLKVQAISGGWVVGATGTVTAVVVWTPGACATALANLPAGTITVSSSTGADTTSTFTINWAATVLQTTVSAVSGTAVTLATPSVQTVSGSTEWAAWGHDDAPGINAWAAATGLNSTYLPYNATYGIYSSISIPNGHRIDFQCDGAKIVALAPMTEMFVSNDGSDFYDSNGSSVERCLFDGMGLAQNNVVDGEFEWFFHDNKFLNATVGNVVTSGHGENATFSSNCYQNDPAVVGYYPQFTISNGYTDNHFTDEVGYNAVNFVVDNSTGAFWTNTHGYNNTGSAYVFNGATTFATQIYADSTPGLIPGIVQNCTFCKIMGWHETTAVSSGAIGAYITQYNAFDELAMGSYNNVSNANAIVIGWALGHTTSNLAEFNQSAYYSAPGYGNAGDGAVCFGYQLGCNGSNMVALGEFDTVAFGGVGVGHSNTTAESGSVSIGDSANDNAATGFAYSPGTPVGAGKNQWNTAVMGISTAGSAAVRLTSNGSAAGATNCANLTVSSMEQTIDVRLIAEDGTAARQYSATWTGHLYTRSGAVSTTLIDGVSSTIVPDTTHSNGTWTGAGATIAADTTNGCLNITFTPPTGNTDVMHIVASVTGPLTQ